MDEWAEIMRYLGSGGVGGVVVGAIWAAISLWGKYRRVSREDNSTTAAEWRLMAKEAWARNATIEKRMDNLRDKHHQDMAVVNDELKACNDDRANLHSQNSRQQEQLDEQKAEIMKLKDHVSKLSGRVERT